MATDTSLPSLEDELTCSICISETPVTLPCGHNFCQGCLDVAWKENAPLACPQCRRNYSSKPELKKNTVLSAIVAAIKTQSSASESDHSKDVPVKQESGVIKCDTCREVKAFKTCLTCMASFCEEHVKPHEENPVFRAHRLTDPSGDLQERICQEHHRIKEFFCKEHECSFCSNCLQQVHRGCDYTTPQERREQKESEMRGMLSQLDRKIDKNNIVMAQIRQQEFELQDDAVARKKTVNTKYQFIRDLIDRDEQDALRAVDKDLKSGQTKLQSLTKMFGQNVEKMSQSKVELSDLLSRADSLSFLQASVQLPFNAKFDPYCPRMNTDSEAVTAYQSSAVALKQLLDKILSVPAENRISLLADFEKVLDKVDVLEVPSPAPEVACQFIKDARQFQEMATPVPEPPQEKNYSSGYSCSPGPVYYPPPPQVVHVMHFQPARNPGAPFRPGGQKTNPPHPQLDRHHDKDKKPDTSKGQKKAEKSEHHHRDKDHGKTPKPTPSGKPPTKSSGSSGKPPTKSSGSSGKPPTKSSGSSRPASAPSRRGK